MKPIRIIALDLDGTLLDSQKNIPERNMEMLARCSEAGIHIVTTTGRAADGVPEQIRTLPGVRYVITTNGGSIVDLKTRKVLERRTIPNEQALRILRVIHSFNVMYDPYIDGRGISEEYFFEHMDDYGLSKPMQAMVRNTRDVVPNILEYVEQTGKDVEKINVFLQDVSQREPIRAALEKEEHLAVTSSMLSNLEINAEDATKGNGLMWLADYLGIDRRATMAFGDGENDISMIRMAGVGVAMHNALDTVKAWADEITLTNDESGVAAAIERLVF